MKKSHNKKIIGVIAVFMIIASVFSLYNIYAVDPIAENNNEVVPETVDPTACELKDKVDLTKLLGLSIKEVGDPSNGVHNFELKSSINSSSADYKEELKNLNLTIKRVNLRTSGFPVGEKLQAGSGDSGKISFSSTYEISNYVKSISGRSIGEQSSLPFIMYIELEATNVGSLLGNNVFKNPSKCTNGVLQAEVFMLDGGEELHYGTDEIPVTNQAVIDELQKQIDALNSTSPVEPTNKKEGIDYTTNIICNNDNSSLALNNLTAELVNGSGKAVDGFVAGKKSQFFCSIKKLTQGHHVNFTYAEDGSVTGSNNLGNLTCNAKVTEKGDENKPGSNDMYINNIYNISANKKIAFGYNVISKTGEKYHNGVTPSCQARCEEAVLVEYGPPIAAVAGLCYEYQVRVTSVVDCKKETEPPAPTRLEVCAPKPSCTGSDGRVFDQGGPNEDFDACIESCDGGKYTSKCSKKCYKEVYGTSGSKKASALSLDYSTSKMFRGRSSQCGNEWNTKGTYHRKDNGSIYCCGSVAPWYYGHLGQGHYTVNYYLNSGNWLFYGDCIPRAAAHFSMYHEDCNDDCQFSKCSGLPISGTERDEWYREDKEKELAVKRVCEAAVTCASRTSSTTFTISISNGDTKIKFPYSTNNEIETLAHNCQTKPYGTANNSILLHYGGCYGSCEGSNWYHSHISFPGSWVNNKKDDISYSVPDSTTGWTEKKGKICLPSNFKDENVRWYNHYLYVKEIKPYIGTENPYSISTYCNKDVMSATTLPTNIDKYNIIAEAKGFGYYDWSFTVKCFYGLKASRANNDKTCTGEDKTGACKDCAQGVNNYRIRSVDNTNLFPATSGEVGKSREPGFNWSKYSDLGIQNSSNSSNNGNNLSEIAKQIQAVGNSVYDGNPEYRIILNQAAREVIDGYKNPKEDYVDNNSMKSYKSSLLRNELRLSTNGCSADNSNCVPSENSLGLINYNPSSK